MTQDMDKDNFATLRQQAEEILRGRPANLADLSRADIQALIHNLQVHQIELELQNEELRATHLALQAARDRYADLYNFAPVGYFTLDVNGVIVEANLTGATLLNVARSSLIGTPLTRFVVPEDREKYAVYRVGLGTGPARQTSEIRLIRRAAGQFPVQMQGLANHDHTGRLIQYKLTVSDISERVRVEEALRESEQLTRSTLDALSANICILDETGAVLAVNQAWRDFAAANQDGLTQNYEGFNYLAVCEAATGSAAEAALAFAAGIRAVIQGKQAVFEFEYPCHSRTEWRWFIGRVTRFRGEGPIRVVVAHDNITERKRAEEILLRTSRLEVATTLVGGIAHDINNLMTPVLGNAELLTLNLNQPDAADMLTAIARSARRASALAQQMLAFVRGDTYQPKLMNLNEVIQPALHLQQLSDPGCSLTVEQQLSSELWPVLADASQMSQVMVNLLTNAIEAGNGQGRICVNTANLVIDEAGTGGSLPPLKPGRYVKLVVEDDGSGMSGEVLDRVFEPFFSTKFQGRGMGLAAVYGIIQNHGGDIFIKSEAGHGTVVKVYLPTVE
jgi:PAS domain S-box-containing protein